MGKDSNAILQDILVPQLLAFLADHPELTYLGLVLTDACKDPVFR